jgi:hypothetical protein
VRRLGRKVWARQIPDSGGNAVKCDICDEEFANSEAVKAHKERDHPMGEVKKEEPELEKPDLLADDLADDSETETEQTEPVARPVR